MRKNPDQTNLHFAVLRGKFLVLRQIGAPTVFTQWNQEQNKIYDTVKHACDTIILAYQLMIT